jgi:hypothetical protein
VFIGTDLESTHKPSSIGTILGLSLRPYAVLSFRTILRHSALDAESRVLSKRENICYETIILSGEVVSVCFDYFLGYTDNCCNSNGEGDGVKNMNNCMLLLLSIIVVLSASCSSNSMRPFAEKFANISRNSGGSYSPTVLLDKFDNPHIFWLDGTYSKSSGSSNIMYVKWNGTNWVTMDGTKYNPNTGNAVFMKDYTFMLEIPSYDIDSSGNAHVTWGDLKVIYYVRSNGVDWVTATGELFEPDLESGIISDPEKSSFCSTTIIDDNGSPHISWFQDHELVCAEFNGKEWEIIETPVGDNHRMSYLPHFTINSKNEPCISWLEVETEGDEFNELHLIRWENNEKWVTLSGETYDEEIKNSNVCTNIDFLPKKINYFSNSNNDPLLYWLNDNYDRQEKERYYTTNPNKDIPIYTKWNNTNWVTKNNSVNIASSNIQNFGTKIKNYKIALDDNGNPHLIWKINKDTQICYIKWNGVNWVCADGSIYDPQNKEHTFVYPAEYVNFYNNITRTSFAIDSNNNPHITWSDMNNGSIEIYYLKWDGENWVTFTNNSD